MESLMDMPTFDLSEQGTGRSPASAIEGIATLGTKRCSTGAAQEDNSFTLASPATFSLLSRALPGCLEPLRTSASRSPQRTTRSQAQTRSPELLGSVSGTSCDQTG